MKFSGFKYLTKEGCKNVWRNRVMSFTSIGVLTTCLIIVGAAYLITVNVNSVVKYIEGQSEMVVIVEEIDQAATTQLENNIKSIENIKSYNYISKEQALQNEMERLGDSAHLLEGYTDRNPLPAIFEIKVKDLSKTRDTAATLRELAGVESVQASDDVADTLTYMQNTVNTFGSALIIVLAIISMVIISNTIRATIFARRKEINIMKYVGATNSFIRIPFLVEGFLLGLISATIAFLVIWGGYQYLMGANTSGMTIWIKSMFDSLIPFKDIALDLGLFFGITGTMLGMIGSGISIRNHARV